MSKKRSRHHPTAPAAVPDDPSRERWVLTWVCVASAGLFLALAWPLLEGKTYAGDDLDHFHLPLRHFYWQCLQNGDAFDWLPNIFCGFYLTGEGQIGTYHPWHWLLYRWLPFETAFNLEVFASYPFLFAGMAGFLRRAGRSRPAALFGAMCFTFSGFCLLHFMHMNGIAIVAHIPWLLWAIDVAVQDDWPRRRLFAWTAIPLLTASQILLGYPQYVWMSFLALVFWACLITSGKDRIGTLFRLAAALLVGALLGAVQLLPTYEHLANSERTALGGSLAHFIPLHPLNVIQLVAPYLLYFRVFGGNTHESGLYTGAIPLMLVAWLFARRSELGQDRKLALAVGAFGGAALLLAFGHYGLIYYAQTWLPIVGNFRVPARYIVLVHFAVAILSAIAFDKWTRSKESSPGRDRGLWSLAGLSLFAVALVWIILPPIMRASGSQPIAIAALKIGSPLAVVAGPILLAIAAVIVTKGRQDPWAACALVMFTAADLGYYGFGDLGKPVGVEPAVHRDARPYDKILQEGVQPPENNARLITALPRPGAFVFMGNQYALGGARLMDGYAGLVPANRLDYRTIAALRVANAGLLMRSPYEENIPGLSRHNQFFLSVPDPMPRFRLVTQAAVSAAPAVDLPKIPIESVALVESPLDLDEGEPGQAQLRSERPGELEISTDAAGSELLVIADRFHAGWQAEVDGQPQPVWRVNGDFMGVVVGLGERVVRLSFRPLSLVYGRTISAIGAALLAIAFLVGLICTRTRPSPPHPLTPPFRAPSARG